MSRDDYEKLCDELTDELAEKKAELKAKDAEIEQLIRRLGEYENEFKAKVRPIHKYL